MFRKVGPAFLIHKEGANPGTGNIVGQEIVRYIGPADGVVLGNPRPGHAVKLARLHGDLNILIGDRHRHHAKPRQEPACRREGVEAQPVKVAKRCNFFPGVEIARVLPRGRKPGHAANLLIGLFPDIGQAILAEQHRHIQRMPRRHREIAAEHPHLGR